MVALILVIVRIGLFNDSSLGLWRQDTWLNLIWTTSSSLIFPTTKRKRFIAILRKAVTDRSLDLFIIREHCTKVLTFQKKNRLKIVSRIQKEVVKAGKWQQDSYGEKQVAFKATATKSIAHFASNVGARYPQDSQKRIIL